MKEAKIKLGSIQKMTSFEVVSKSKMTTVQGGSGGGRSIVSSSGAVGASSRITLR